MGRLILVQNRLYEKMSVELATWVAEVLKLPPCQVLEKAYEKVIKDDFLMLFENDDWLSPAQLRLLYAQEYPLDMLYQHWLGIDDNHMEDLRESAITATERRTQ